MAVDLVTGWLLSRVIVEVDGVKHEVEADERGRYRLALELSRGFYTVRVILPDSGVAAREVRVRVL